MRNSGPAWLLIVLGAIVLALAICSIMTGRVSQSGGRKCGIMRNYEVERDHSPFQFWFLVLGQVLIGIVLLYFGIQKVAE